jgi:hypothetical protein
MKGGGINYLPLPPEITDPFKFANNFNLISMTAHGSQDGNVFLVPENTWILFRGPASASIERRELQEELLNRFRFLNPGESVKEYYTRIFEAVRDRELFKNVLFSPESPFQPGKLSIYEPGDLIQNVAFDIHNFQYPFALIGVWKLPLPRDILDTIENANKTYKEIADEYRAHGYNATGPLNEILKESERSIMQHKENAMYKMGLGNQSSIYEVLNKRNQPNPVNPAGTFPKKYTFIVVESCRASEDLPQHMHIMPENVQQLEENPAGFLNYLKTKYRKIPGKSNTNYEAQLKEMAESMTQSIKRSRRLSLGVRKLPESCYKSLFLLSRENFVKILNAPGLSEYERMLVNGLIGGRLVPKGQMIEILKAPRNLNTRLLNLPHMERFFVGEGVQVGGAYAIVTGIEIQRGAGNTADIAYKVRFADGHVETKRGSEMTHMDQEEFAGIRMSMTNAEQAALTAPVTVDQPIGVPPAAAVAAQAGPVLLFPEYGSKFFVKPDLASKVDDIKKEMGKFSFQPYQEAKIKATPAGPLAGKRVEIQPEIQYLEGKGFRYMVRLDDGSVRAMNPAFLDQEFSGGGHSSKLASKFCRCIKHVRKTVRVRGKNKSRKAKESAAIGICTKSVVQKRGRTLKRFKCAPKPSLQTQKVK